MAKRMIRLTEGNTGASKWLDPETVVSIDSNPSVGGSFIHVYYKPLKTGYSCKVREEPEEILAMMECEVKVSDIESEARALKKQIYDLQLEHADARMKVCRMKHRAEDAEVKLKEEAAE